MEKRVTLIIAATVLLCVVLLLLAQRQGPTGATIGPEQDCGRYEPSVGEYGLESAEAVTYGGRFACELSFEFFGDPSCGRMVLYATPSGDIIGCDPEVESAQCQQLCAQMPEAEFYL